MITRENAVEILYKITGTEFLCREYTDKLQEIATCIEGEEYGQHLWDADSDYIELFTMRSEDEWTDEAIDKAKKIEEKYRFVPSPFERGKIK